MKRKALQERKKTWGGQGRNAGSDVGLWRLLLEGRTGAGAPGSAVWTPPDTSQEVTDNVDRTGGVRRDYRAVLLLGRGETAQCLESCLEGSVWPCPGGPAGVGVCANPGSGGAGIRAPGNSSC